MSGAHAALNSICCCKVLPFAPCDYLEARAWYLANPNAFPSLNVSVSAMEAVSRYLVNPPGTTCGLCFDKQASEVWTASSATVVRVPVQSGPFNTGLARWESAWMPAGSITQTPGRCSTVLGCCTTCCDPPDPPCIPNYQEQWWYCDFNGGLCGCRMPYTYPMPATYYYGCQNENYEDPSPCAACSSRTIEYNTRQRPPTYTESLYRIIITDYGSLGGLCDHTAIPACPPPFLSYVIWSVRIDKGTRSLCGDGTGPIVVSQRNVAWLRRCCNYLAGPRGTYQFCAPQFQTPSGSSTSTVNCDGATHTWQYSLTATVS